MICLISCDKAVKGVCYVLQSVIALIECMFFIAENAVDVPIEARQNSEVNSASIARGENMIQEEMMQAQAVATESVHSKQNGGIPIIITDADTPESEVSLPYSPEDTVYEPEEDAKVAKSLEEQVLELEKEVEKLDTNHVEERIAPVKTVTAESKPNISNNAAVAQKSSGSSCKKVFAYTFFSLFLTLTVSVCVVMFSDVKHPIANEIRNHLTFLEPTRDFLLHKYQELVNKL